MLTADTDSSESATVVSLFVALFASPHAAPPPHLCVRCPHVLQGLPDNAPEDAAVPKEEGGQELPGEGVHPGRGARVQPGVEGDREGPVRAGLQDHRPAGDVVLRAAVRGPEAADQLVEARQEG